MKTELIFNPTSGALDAVKYADSHAELLNRTAADSHPIGAVAGTVAGAIPYVGAANALVESASLAWDSADKRLNVAGNTTTAGAINGNINSYMNRLIAGIPTNPLAWETGVTGPGSGAFAGGVLLPSGKVFCVPSNYASNQNIYHPCVIGWPYGQWMLHPMFNKL